MILSTKIEEEQRLDAAFAALMSYILEEEDLDEREQRPTLKYRFPRVSIR